jgi:type II secretion system protein N
MKEQLLRYGQLVAFPAFYLFCLPVFASLTFPYDKLKERIVYAYNDEQRAAGAQQELHVETMSGYWLSGVRMKGVELVTASSEAGKPPSKLEIDEATVRYAILPALVGSGDLGFSVDAFGGTISGSIDSHGKDRSLDADLDGLDLGQITPLVTAIGLPLGGSLGGRIRLSMPEGASSKAVGAISFESKDTTVGDGKAKLKGALALPRVDVGTITFGADVKDGVVKITKFVAAGKDLDLQGDGRVTLRDQTAESLCDLQVRFRVNETYRAKSDNTKSLFGAPGSTTPGLFDLDPKVKQSKRADGFYGWAVRGPFTRLDFSPAAR